MTTSLSVVIPTLDEEGTIVRCLEAVGAAPVREIVISDGGSTDRTVEIATGHPAVRVVSGPPGRGGQLHRGARAARGETLLFLHADCRLPHGWYPAVVNALAEHGVSLACFRLHTEPTGPAGPLRRAWFRLLDLRSFLGALPYGDQGYALRHSTYETLGGFPDIPLMEDVELARAARRAGRIRTLPLEMRTSARRVERHPIRNRVMTATFPWLYRAGVRPETLATWYRAIR